MTLSEIQNAADAGANERLIWAGLALVATLLVGAAALAWADRWRRRMTSDPAGGDELTAYRLSYERGELSEEEYRRIRNRLTGRSPPPVPPEAPTTE